jgi:formylglycine-generating enzyme required for sulfatase activity
MHRIFYWLFALLPFAAFGQSPIPNDPFLSVPAPSVRQRPVEPAPRPVQSQQQPASQPRGSGYPVAVGQSFRDCAVCPEMMVIPAGTFTMGSPADEPDHNPDEGPLRRVSLNEPLAVGRLEVTFAEWDACQTAGGCRHRPDAHGWGRGNRPVMNVSWEDAHQYLGWLSQRTRRNYRLLTEAEWEYAARGGTTTAYFTGASISSAHANFAGGAGGGLGRTQPVGSYAANRFGLHDMVGNVWEWVEDCYVDSYAGAPSDASRAVTGGADCSRRVVRGGSWFTPPRVLRSADRFSFRTEFRGHFLGLRVARMPGS